MCIEVSRQEYWKVTLLQGIFPTQGSNRGLLPCRQILYHVTHQLKLRNTGSLSLIQRIFPTQESNWGFLDFRQILYQLSYQGSSGHCLLNQERITFGKNRQRLTIFQVQFSVQFSRSVVSDSLQPHESQHTRPPCLSPTPGVYSNSYPSSQ